MISIEDLPCLKHSVCPCLDCLGTVGAWFKVPAGNKITDVDVGNNSMGRFLTQQSEVLAVRSPMGNTCILQGEIETASKESELPKLCINCEHVSDSNSDWTKFRCFAPQNFDELCLVDGHKIYKLEFCKDIRDEYSIDGTNLCGPKGIWFILKKEKPLTPSYSPTTTETTFEAKDLESLSKGANDAVARAKAARAAKSGKQDFNNL